MGWGHKNPAGVGGEELGSRWSKGIGAGPSSATWEPTTAQVPLVLQRCGARWGSMLHRARFAFRKGRCWLEFFQKLFSVEKHTRLFLGVVWQTDKAGGEAV